MTDGPVTIGDALPLEIERVQNLLPIYDQIPMGFFAATMMRASLKRAVASLANGDVVEMIRCYEDLKGYEA